VKLGIISKGLQDFILKMNIPKGMDKCKNYIRVVIGASGGGGVATRRRERKGLSQPYFGQVWG